MLGIEMGDLQPDDVLYRRLPLNYIKEDGSVSSAAYMTSKPRLPDEEVSVDLERLTTIQQTLSRAPHPRWAIGAVTVRDVQALGLTVEPAPLPTNRAHCLIKGLKSKADCSKLAGITRIIYKPLS